VGYRIYADSGVHHVCLHADIQAVQASIKVPSG